MSITKETMSRCLHKVTPVPESWACRDAANDHKFAGQSMAELGIRKPRGYQSMFHPMTGKLMRNR